MNRVRTWTSKHQIKALSLALLGILGAYSSQAWELTGKVVNQKQPTSAIFSADITLKSLGQKTFTDGAGLFTLIGSDITAIEGQVRGMEVLEDGLHFQTDRSMDLHLIGINALGARFLEKKQRLGAGAHTFKISELAPKLGNGIFLLTVRLGDQSAVVRIVQNQSSASVGSLPIDRQKASTFVDTLVITKSGYKALQIPLLTLNQNMGTLQLEPLSSSSTTSSSSIASGNCAGIPTWSNTLNYAASQSKVVWKNALWQNQWYANQGDEPGVNQVWVKTADCQTVVSSSSVIGTSSINVSSSSAISSSATGCTKTLVDNYAFSVGTGTVIFQGHQQGPYNAFSAGDKVVPEGRPCSEAVTVSPSAPGDSWNLYLASAYNGPANAYTRLEKVTGGTGTSSSIALSSSAKSSSSIAVSSSIVVSSSAKSSSSVVSSSSSTNNGTGLAAWLTKSTFDQLFPKRAIASCIADGNGIYTYENFIAAAKRWPVFGTTGTDLIRKREVAAFFAHLVQETGSNTNDPTSGLCWTQERCAVTGSQSCKNNYNQDWSGQYPPQPGKYYYGRGPKQLSWPGNYGWFSQEVYGDKMRLLSDPELIVRDGIVAFESSLWFWNQRSEYWTSPATPTLHAVMTANATLKGHRGFEATTFSINGALECSAGNQAMTKRANNYLHFQRALGIPEADVDKNNLYCTRQ